MGACWDVELMERVGQALGSEGTERRREEAVHRVTEIKPGDILFGAEVKLV